MSFGKFLGAAAPIIGGAAGAFFGGPAGAAAGASMGAGVSGFLGAQEANSANKQIAADNRAFQADQTSTAYQRATADMRAAGLNPMLAYSQGGASSASGSTAQMVNELEPLASSISTAAKLKFDKDMMDNTVKKTESDIKVQDSLKELQETQKDLNKQSAKKVQAETATAENNARVSKIEADIADMGMPYVEKTMKTMGMGVDAINTMKNILRKKAGSQKNSAKPKLH